MNRIGSAGIILGACVLLACGAWAQSSKGPAHPASGSIVKNVGEEVSFTLVARDNNGLVIRGWDTVGKDITLVVTNSTANTDAEPLTAMTIKDVNGNPLSQLGANVFLLPKTLFIDGVAEIRFTTTKADTSVYISVVPSTGGLNTIGETMDFLPGPVTNFRTEILPAAQPNIVYLMRKYELRVTPRDRYNNPNPSVSILSRLTARYPGEFSTADGGAGLFAGEIFIQGMTNYFLTSSQPRTNQEIICYASADRNLRGSTGQYVVADHAPGAFNLLVPHDFDDVRLTRAKDTVVFWWQSSHDPYNHILMGGQFFSDTVFYSFRVQDTTSKRLLFETAAGDFGSDTTLVTTHAQALDWFRQYSGLTWGRFPILWSVVARDGLFATRSIQEWHFTIIIPIPDAVPNTGTPSLQLSQNFPNPFNPGTNIGFELQTRAFVTLDIFDPVGRIVARLVNDERDPGSHTCTFDARDLPSGSYLIRLTAGGRAVTRMMTLMR